MIKVLIADDEPTIRDGLSQMIDWSLYSMEVMAVCANGKEAVLQITDQPPDLCVLDVRMPYRYGLEVAQLFKELNPLGEVLFISGHDEFSYAQKALSLGAHHYLLKPLDFKELDRVLNLISNTIISRQSQIRDMAEIKSFLKKNKNTLTAHFMQSLLNGELETEELLANLHFFTMSDKANANMYLIKREHANSRDEKIDACTIEVTVLQILENSDVFLSPDGNIIVFSYEDEDFSTKISSALPSDMKCCVYSARLENRIENPIVTYEGYLKILAQIRNSNTMLPIIRKTTNFIDTNYADSSLTLNSFAEQNAISLSYLCRLFKQEHGQTWRQYLSKFRTNKAIEYLQDTNLKIYNISEMVGYKTQHYFCEIFTQNTGFSPSEYRKRFMEGV